MMSGDAKADVVKRLRALGRSRLRAERRRAEIMDETRPLILHGRTLGIGPTELAEITGLTRRAVYDILDKADT